MMLTAHGHHEVAQKARKDSDVGRISQGEGRGKKHVIYVLLQTMLDFLSCKLRHKHDCAQCNHWQIP